MRRLYCPRDFEGRERSFRVYFRASFMAEDAGKKEPPSLDEFSERLDAHRGEPEREQTPKGSGAAWGRAMRMSTDLLAGLFVGTLLGFFLDRWLGTAPGFLLAGIGLGFAAGLRNVARTMNEDNETSSEN